MGFYEGEKTFQAIYTDGNTVWPICYLDNPKRRTPLITSQETIEYRWSLFFSILNKDNKAATQDETNAIIQSTREMMDDFILGLVQKTDDNGRKIFQRVEPGEEIDIQKLFDGVLSGVGCPIILTPMDKTISC